MRKLIFVLAIVSLVASCSPGKRLTTEMKNQNEITSDTERDGSSFAKAVLIKEKNERAGVDAEYAWIRSNYPGYQLRLQALSYENKKPYDIIHITTVNGEEKSIYFDISNFYGKF